MEKKDKLKTVLTQIRKAQDAGFSQEDINNYILDSGYNSLKAFDKAVVNRASIGVRKRHPESEAGAILGYVREVASGLTLGLSNMGEALIYSIVNSTPYEFEKELLQTEREEYQDASPVLATTGGLAGAMVTGLGATKLAYKTAPSLLPKVGAPISNIAKEATLEAGLGAIEGGVTAATSGGDTTTAAELGAGIGFISPLASRVVSPIIDFTNKGIRRVRGEAPGIGGAEERALKKLDESFVNDGMTKADRLEKLMEFEDAGMGDQVRTGYLGKSNVHQLSKDAINAPGPAKTQVKEGLLADKEANSELTTKFMKEGLGYADEGGEALKTSTLKQMKSEAQPLYDEAYKLPPINNKEMDNLLRTLNDTTKGDFYERVKAIAKREIALLDPEVQKTVILPDEMPYGDVPVAVVDFYKRATDDLIDAARGNDKRTLIRMKDKILKIADAETMPLKDKLLPDGATVPDDLQSPFARARAIWSEGNDNVKAYDLGEQVYGAKSASKIKAEFDALKSEAERHMYRLGASTEAVVKVEGGEAPTRNFSKKFLTKEAKKKHQILFGNQKEAEGFVKRLELLSEMHAAAGDMIPRSDTTAGIMRFVSGAWDLVRGGGSLTGKAISRGGALLTDQVMQDSAKATNKELGRILSEPGAKHARGVLQNTDALEKQMKGKMIRRGLLSGAITSGAASMLGGGGLLQ